MAKVTPLLGLSHSLSNADEVRAFLRPHGITYDRWEISENARKIASQPVLDEEAKTALLRCFESELAELATKEGYVTSDMVCLQPDFEGLANALANFDREHYHTDDEVRFIADGMGVFGFEGEDGRKFIIEVEAGDYIVIPAYRWHWFYMCSGSGIKAIRIFKDQSGWTPFYKPMAPIEGGN